MRVASVLCIAAYASSVVAFHAPRRRAPPRARVARASATLPSEIREAFEACKTAAALFPDGSEERETAQGIVDKLQNASFSSWQGEDMVLLDSCLVDEDQEACVAFMDAMGRLRELHEGSPGNA